MTIQDRPLWRDYSANQDKLDTAAIIHPEIAIANGVVGFIMRSSTSWNYKDPTFNYLYPKIVGAYRTSYHNFSPGADIEKQLDNWLLQHPVIDIIPRFAAVEINWNELAPFDIAATFKEFSNAYLEREGQRPGIYTRKQLADLWLTPFLSESFLNEHWWWLAQYDSYRYTEEDKPLVPPNKVDPERCWLKQTADQMAGFPGEAESEHVDRDRFMFEDMHAWIALNFGNDAPNIPDDCCEELRQELNDAWIEWRNTNTGMIDNILDIKELEAKTSQSLNKILDDIQKLKVDNLLMAGMVKTLKDEIHGLEGGHSHPAWMYTLGLVK